jgi:hypothetical protein
MMFVEWSRIPNSLEMRQLCVPCRHVISRDMSMDLNGVRRLRDCGRRDHSHPLYLLAGKLSVGDCDPHVSRAEK